MPGCSVVSAASPATAAWAAPVGPLAAAVAGASSTVPCRSDEAADAAAIAVDDWRQATSGSTAAISSSPLRGTPPPKSTPRACNSNAISDACGIHRPMSSRTSRPRTARKRDGVHGPCTPRSSTRSTASARWKISSASCSITITVRPLRARIRSMVARTSAVPAGSRFEVGSSRMSTAGSSASIAASATRCFSPPESSSMPRRLNPASPARSRASSMRRWISAGSNR